MLSVNYNPSVPKAQNNLSLATNALTKSLERMSTGFKINSAKDDAAGMYVATKMTTQIRGLLQARKNTNDGISYLSTASESLGGMTDLLNRIRDLAVQGANGVYDETARAAMQAEADELTRELYRLKNSTVFNGKAIFGEAEESLAAVVSKLSPSPESKLNAASSVKGITNTLPEGYTAIYTAEDLGDINDNNGKYILMNDIDMSGYGNWKPLFYADHQGFQGVFDGNGYVIKNLHSSGMDVGGLFYITNNAEIKNLGMENIDIDSISFMSAGALVTDATGNTRITNCYSTGNIKGQRGMGGLVSTASGLTLSNCYSSCNVTGKSSIGGLVGYASNVSKINNCYSTGAVTGTEMSYTAVGGIVGNNDGSISNCYVTGKVSGRTNTGAITGYNEGIVENVIWNTETCGTMYGVTPNSGTVQNVIGLSTAEMTNSQYYKDLGWSDSDWDFSSAPPKLLWQTHPPQPPDPSAEEGNLRLQIGANADSASAIYVDTLFELGVFSVDFSNSQTCRNAIETVDELLKKITQKNSDLGAILNRLDSVLELQTTSIENLTAARSSIQDSDIAEESANYVKNQILQQTTASLLSQAQLSNGNVIRQLIQY